MISIAQIAEAVATEINAGTFTPAVTAVRSFRPQFDLKDLSDLKVTVVPKAIEASPADRSRLQRDCRIDVAVQKRVSATDASAEMDDLLQLADDIVAHMARRPLADQPAARWLAVSQKPIYAVDHLEQYSVFTAVIELTYRIVE